MGSLDPDCWSVIQTYIEQGYGVSVCNSDKLLIEESCEVEHFDGGCFLSIGNSFDLFVLPERRGKWKVRSVISEFLARKLKEYDFLTVGIFEWNRPSLRLAKHFGFVETGRNNGMVTLMKHRNMH